MYRCVASEGIYFSNENQMDKGNHVEDWNHDICRDLLEGVKKIR